MESSAIFTRYVNKVFNLKEPFTNDIRSNRVLLSPLLPPWKKLNNCYPLEKSWNNWNWGQGGFQDKANRIQEVILNIRPPFQTRFNIFMNPNERTCKICGWVMLKAWWWFVLIFLVALTVLFTFWISSRRFIKAVEHKNTCPLVCHQTNKIWHFEAWNQITAVWICQTSLAWWHT